MHPRQDQPERVGELPLDALAQRLERARRADRNPYALDRNPCGSSSGSGAAVAAEPRGGRGRHRDGRLDRLPRRRSAASSASSRRSGWCRSGASSRSRTARTPPGPMAPRSRGRPALLSVSAPDERRRPHPALRRRADWLEGKRIGVPRGTFWGYRRRWTATRAALELLAAAGATIVDDTVRHGGRLRARGRAVVLLTRAAANAAAYLATRDRDAPQTLADLVAFNREHSADLELAPLRAGLSSSRHRGAGDLDSDRSTPPPGGGPGRPAATASTGCCASTASTHWYPGYPPAIGRSTRSIGEHVTGG